jgi:hypothetical protein
MVAVKPVARWQIWLGKWLGIMMINGALLLVTGSSVYGLLQWRAHQLPEAQRRVLEKEIFVARAAVAEVQTDYEAMATRIFRERIQEIPVPAEEQAGVRNLILERLKAYEQSVEPNHRRQWNIELGLNRFLLKDEPMFIRFKFYAAQTNLTGTYLGLWDIGPREDSERMVSVPMSLAAASFHEIEIPPNLFDDTGKLTVEFINQNDTVLLFPLEDGFEVLYREGGFALNYVRGLLILLSWLGLLSALGLAAASLMTFPVAAFFSLSLMVVALSSGTLASVVDEGTVAGSNHETGQASTMWLDRVILPVFKAILGVVGLVDTFAPVDALSTGRSITWGRLGQAWGQVVGLLGGMLALGGIYMLHRRELALPQGGG